MSLRIPNGGLPRLSSSQVPRNFSCFASDSSTNSIQDPTLYITEPIKIHAMEWNWTTGRNASTAMRGGEIHALERDWTSGPNALTAMRGGEIHALERHRNELVVQFQKRCLPP